VFTLRNVMRINAASCLIFGGLFVLVPATVGSFLAENTPAPDLYIVILGIALIINGLHLLWASMRIQTGKYMVWYFSSADILWVIASLALLLSELWVTSPAGIVTTLLIALLVGLLGVVQIRLNGADH